MSIDEFNDALKTKSYDDILRELNSKTRLPKTNGYWQGKRGEGLWYSDNPKVQAITKGQGIEFKNERPDFSQWSKGDLEFEPDVVNGTDNDFAQVYKKIQKDYDLPSQKSAEKLLKDLGLTPHHNNSN